MTGDVRLPGGYDLAHLQAFHRYILGDVYAWAGLTRLGADPEHPRSDPCGTGSVGTANSCSPRILSTVRLVAQLEHHRHQPQPGHRGPHGLALSGQILQRGTHEDPHPLIGRTDQSVSAINPTA